MYNVCVCVTSDVLICVAVPCGGMVRCAGADDAELSTLIALIVTL